MFQIIKNFLERIHIKKKNEDDTESISLIIQQFDIVNKNDQIYETYGLSNNIINPDEEFLDQMITYAEVRKNEALNCDECAGRDKCMKDKNIQHNDDY